MQQPRQPTTTNVPTGDPEAATINHSGQNSGPSCQQRGQSQAGGGGVVGSTCVGKFLLRLFITFLSIIAYLNVTYLIQVVICCLLPYFNSFPPVNSLLYVNCLPDVNNLTY